LQPGHDIGPILAAIVDQWALIKWSKARCQNDRSHLERDTLLDVVEIDGLGRTKLFTSLAFAVFKIDAVGCIDGVFERHGLLVGHVDRLAFDKLFVKRVRDLFGAFFCAQTACDALVHVHITRTLYHLDTEKTFPTRNLLDVTQGEQLNIVMPADLDQFG
jgi:hypothetical protein